MVSGICYFHLVIPERERFSQLGGNIGCEFNDSSRGSALRDLLSFAADKRVEWDSLFNITGQIT